MRLSNELFAKAIDWLYANNKVKDQKELAAVLTTICLLLGTPRLFGSDVTTIFPFPLPV